MATPLAMLRRWKTPLLAGFSALFVITGFSGLNAAAADGDAHGRVAEAVVDGAIDPGSGEFIQDAITRAERHDYEALIIRLNTPGGLVDTTREIVARMFDAQIPIIVYVAPSAAHAGSAGVFITMAANVAAMAPGSNIGAAHPIFLGGGGDEKKDENEDDDQKVSKKKGEWEKSDQDILKKKIENDISAFAESIAKERGRNVEWAIKAVRESDAISADKAVETHVVDLIASSRDDLLSQIDGRTVTLGPTKISHVLHTKGAPVDELSWSLKTRFLHVIGDPSIASILISLGSLGLLIEFFKPGAIVPGVMGAILLLLGVVGGSQLPVNAGGVALLLLGIGMAVTEFFVTSHGLLGVAGAIAFSSGVLLLFDPTGDNFFADRSFGVQPLSVLPTTIFCIAVALFVGYSAVRARMLKPVVGMRGMVGELCNVELDIAPGAEGKVLVHGELWRAVSDCVLAKGARAKVVEVNGLTLRVEPPDA